MLASRLDQPKAAFTLIELLVVISIIAVLVGLAFPVIGSALDRAKKVQAKNDVMQIVTAVNAYYTEYGIYPLNSGNNNGASDTVYGDPNGTYSSGDLFNILRAIPDSNYNANNQLNPKQIVFFNGPNAKDQSKPRGGFFTGTTGVSNVNGYSIKPGSYTDPWGDDYVVFVDADYNGDINTALGWFYNDYAGGKIQVKAGVGACSLGKDGTWGTNGNKQAANSDDILSWQ